MSDQIEPDTASGIIMQRVTPGLEVINIKDEEGNTSHIFKMQGKEIVVNWPAEFTKDETWRKNQ